MTDTYVFNRVLSQKGTFLLFLVNKPIPLPPSLKTKGRGLTNYITVIYTLPLLLKGRVGEGLRIEKVVGQQLVFQK